MLSDGKKRKLYDEFGDDAAKIGWDEKKAEMLPRLQVGGEAAGGAARPSSFDFGGGGRGGFDFDATRTWPNLRAALRPAPRRAARPGAGGDLHAQLSVSLKDAVLGAQSAAQRRAASQVHGAHSRRGGAPGRLRWPGRASRASAAGRRATCTWRSRCEPHPLVRREGKDLYVDLPVTVKEAALGAEVQVPTFSARAR